MPESFTGIVDHVIKTTGPWREWVQLSEPQQRFASHAALLLCLPSSFVLLA
jgi:hypothetical protein